MIETLGGAKYIEKDPPMVGDADLSRKVVDYLAYLKEQINFILSTNGRRVTKVSGEASSAAEAASSANYQEQLVYKSAAAGTATMAKPATWVTDETGAQNTWTLKRPPYNSSYPVLFIATQRKSVGGEVSCTTPMIDDTTTVIDGGNIITGTVTANEIDIADLFAQNITASHFNITGGSIAINTNDATEDRIVLRYDDFELSLSPSAINAIYYDHNDHTKYRVVQLASLFAGLRVMDTDGAIGGIAIGHRVWIGGEGYGGQDGQYEVYDSDGKKRAQLDKTGLTFYDANGNVTRSYPAT